MRIHHLQHVPFEGLAMIEGWATSRGCSLQSTKFYENDYALPTADEYDVLVVLGGSMSVNDVEAYPWLAEEKAFIKGAIDAGKHVLGICLGAQLIAQVLGAKVAPHSQKEIGWFPIAFTDQVAGHPLLSGLNQGMKVLHWHGERFDMPDGAVRIVSSAACDNQGFLYKESVLALQFHLEMDEAAVSRIVVACSDELGQEQEGRYVQSAETILEQASRQNLQPVLSRVLDNWLCGGG